jgi:hypothetical protein
MQVSQRKLLAVTFLAGMTVGAMFLSKSANQSNWPFERITCPQSAAGKLMRSPIVGLVAIQRRSVGWNPKPIPNGCNPWHQR